MISHKHKFIFIEVPKTGTTSICSVLDENWQVNAHKKHQDLEQYKENYPQEINKYFKFSFLRNPWCRTVSLYNREESIRKSEILTFPEFVDWITLSTDTCNKPTPKKNMIDFFTIDGEIAMDFIGKTEDLQNGFDIVCDKTGIPRQELPHINSTNHKHYTEYYNDKTKQIIADKFAKDIEYFNYKFGQ
tara:strand:- start:112 stop:675 length:564 start_codon:yes stop_codon:yes gene_type:complete